MKEKWDKQNLVNSQIMGLFANFTRAGLIKRVRFNLMTQNIFNMKSGTKII